LIRHERAENAAHFQQVMPVLVGARQPAHLQAENDADVIDGHLGQQPLKPGSIVGVAAALALVFVDDLDPIGRPSQGDGVIDQGVLPQPGFAVFQDLLRAGLADVHERQAVQVPTLDLGGTQTDNRAARGRYGGIVLAMLLGQGWMRVSAAHAPPPRRWVVRAVVVR
jgi:hypothetical protein